MIADRRQPVSRPCVFFNPESNVGTAHRMTRLFRWRRVGLSTAACLVLAVANAVVSSQAQAGCSHPWVQRSGLTGSAIDAGALTPGLQAILHDPGFSRPADRRDPCAGRACSRPSRWPGSPTIASSPPPDHWVNLPASCPPSFPGSQRFRPEEGERLPALFTAPLERPPRFGSAC